MDDLKIGDSVNCPPRRYPKTRAYTGVVTWVGVEGTDRNGKQFKWVTVRHPNGKEENWPSNRLSKGEAQCK